MTRPGSSPVYPESLVRLIYPRIENPDHAARDRPERSCPWFTHVQSVQHRGENLTRIITKRRVSALVVTALSGLIVAATAGWLANGTGDGYVRTGTVSAPTFGVVTEAELADPLFPGETGALSLKLTNNNEMPLVLKSFTSNNGGNFIMVSGNSLCSDPEIDLITQSGLSIPVPVGTSVVDIPGAVQMQTISPSNCQGAVFRTPIAATFSTP